MFEHQTQSQQLSLTFTLKIEEIFEALETVDMYMTPSDSIIKPISNRNFGNTYHHKNGPNQCEYTHQKKVKSTNTETLDNSTNSETLVNTINKLILVNSINPDPFKYQVPNQSHT